MRKPVLSLQCDKPGCGGVLRENLLAPAKASEPPVERDDAGWYFIKCPACASPYRLPPNGAHMLHTLVRNSSLGRLVMDD